MMMKKSLILILTAICLLSCAANTKSLDVPDQSDLQEFRYIYGTTDGTTSVKEPSKITELEYLENAKYAGRMKDNTVKDDAVTIVLTTKENQKIYYYIYQEDGRTYLEDVNHLDLYTLDDKAYTDIVNQ
jgi:hypothetical protein